MCWDGENKSWDVTLVALPGHPPAHNALYHTRYGSLDK